MRYGTESMKKMLQLIPVLKRSILTASLPRSIRLEHMGQA